MPDLARRTLIHGAAGVLTLGGLAACSPVPTPSPPLRTVSARLRPGLRGPYTAAARHDRVLVDRQLPTDTSVHWHAVALRNDMDGVPAIPGARSAPAAGSPTSSPSWTRHVSPGVYPVEDLSFDLLTCYPQGV